MSQTKDMTIGNPSKLILAFGMPLLAGNLLQQLYNMVDTIVVGRGVGVDALAAVGATGSINFLVLGFIMGMAQGVSILTAQFFLYIQCCMWIDDSTILIVYKRCTFIDGNARNNYE